MAQNTTKFNYKGLREGICWVIICFILTILYFKNDRYNDRDILEMIHALAHVQGYSLYKEPDRPRRWQAIKKLSIEDCSSCSSTWSGHSYYYNYIPNQKDAK